jgi:hypothetical protein
MTDQTAPTGANRGRTAFILLCVYLILSLLWRLFVPAHEYPGRTSMILDMVIDAGVILGLIAARKTGPQPLFWIALIAGLGLFAIRFTSDASWWTGHLIYYLPAR